MKFWSKLFIVGSFVFLTSCGSQDDDLEHQVAERLEASFEGDVEFTREDPQCYAESIMSLVDEGALDRDLVVHFVESEEAGASCDPMTEDCTLVFVILNILYDDTCKE